MAGDRLSARAVVERNRELQALADPITRELLDAMKGQLLLVLAQRLGGKVRVPVAEIDGTGDLIMSMRVDGAAFVFEVGKKN